MQCDKKRNSQNSILETLELTTKNGCNLSCVSSFHDEEQKYAKIDDDKKSYFKANQ